MKPPLRWQYAGLILALLLTNQPRAQGQGNPPEDLAAARKRLIDVQWQILENEARIKVSQEEEILLANAQANDPMKLPGEREGLAKLLTDRLQQTQEKRRKAMEDLRAKMEDKKNQAEVGWRKAMEAHLSFPDLKAATEADYGIDPQGVKDSPWWDLTTLGILIWGALLFFVSLLLGWHGARRQLRSRFRFKGKMGAAAALIVGLAYWIPSLAWAQEKATEWLPKNRQELDAKIAELNLKNQTLKKVIVQGTEKIDKARKERQAALFPKDQEDIRKNFLNLEDNTFKEFHQLMVAAALTETASERALGIMSQVDEHQANLAEAVAAERANFWIKGGVKVGLCLSFVGLAFLPLRRMQRRLRKELAQQADLCPRCLAPGSLELRVSEVQDNRYPEPEYLECAECRHKFRASYQKLPRLCFPTVGIRGSGKTHWLVTAYDMTKNNRVPVRSSIQNAPSLADEEFDMQIEEILENHKSARGTVHGDLPYPLVLHVQDCDRLGKNSCVLNLFDFAGEMMRQHIDTDMLRRRALLMDGFMLFIDPAQVQTKRGLLALKDQIKSLHAFHEEMRDMRGLDVGTPVPVPIAVCISKLDLVTKENPLSGSARPWIKTLRESFARPVTLAEIHKRSKLCEQVMGVMFPGWNLTRTLEENFGGRFMFFPMTPVSLVEAELGESDLTKRTFAPVGIMEPICWLMHMHGFCMFS